MALVEMKRTDQTLYSTSTDLPENVQREVRSFADVNVVWLSRMLVAGGLVAQADAAARGRADIALFDTLIATYQAIGLLPASHFGPLTVSLDVAHTLQTV